MLLLHGLCITFLTTFVYSFSIRNTFLTLYRNKKNINNPILKNIDEILENNPESKVIVSTPGGLFGYYFMGVSSFIKEHYDLSDYVFTGASAGAWNSLFLSLNKENTILVDELLKTDIKNIEKILKPALEKYIQGAGFAKSDEINEILKKVDDLEKRVKNLEEKL